MKNLILGTIAIDDLTTPFGSEKSILGGSASYASIACSLFSKCSIASVVGEDFPQKYYELFEDKGIGLSNVEVMEGKKTFHWVGEYGADLNSAKTIRTDLNVIDGWEPKLKDSEADFLFLGNFDPDVQISVLRQMKKRPKLVIADTMNLWIDIKREKVIELIKEVDICLMNDGEARQLFGTTNLVTASKKIIELDSEIAIIKKGEHGVIMFTEDNFFACPGYPLENVKDPTGAGDSFGGAMLGYLSKTNDFSEPNLRKAIIYGSSVASLNAEGFSVDKLKKISIGDVEKRYSEFREFVKF